jgi:hypothetical protein
MWSSLLELTDSGIVHKLSIRWNPDDTATAQSKEFLEDPHMVRRRHASHLTLILGGSRVCGFRIIECEASRQLPHARKRIAIALCAIGGRCGGSVIVASGGRRYFALLDFQIFGLVIIETLTASLSAWKCQVLSLAFPIAVLQCRRSFSCVRAVVAQGRGPVLTSSGGCGSWNRGLEASAMSMLRTMTQKLRDIWRQREA